MQVRVFTIPIGDAGILQDELNRFLRGKRVLEVCERFVEEGANSRWCFLVKYLEGEAKDGAGSGNRRDRVDYKDVLDAAAFARFARLRVARKKVAEEDGLPAFALFTDEQMAELAKENMLTIEAMKKVRGIGAGKAERFGARLLALLNGEDHAAAGQSD
jgi:superfamily II DNA helicase RecQ